MAATNKYGGISFLRLLSCSTLGRLRIDRRRLTAYGTGGRKIRAPTTLSNLNNRQIQDPRTRGLLFEPPKLLRETFNLRKLYCNRQLTIRQCTLDGVYIDQWGDLLGIWILAFFEFH